MDLLRNDPLPTHGEGQLLNREDFAAAFADIDCEQEAAFEVVQEQVVRELAAQHGSSESLQLLLDKAIASPEFQARVDARVHEAAMREYEQEMRAALRWEPPGQRGSSVFQIKSPFLSPAEDEDVADADDLELAFGVGQMSWEDYGCRMMAAQPVRNNLAAASHKDMQVREVLEKAAQQLEQVCCFLPSMTAQQLHRVASVPVCALCVCALCQLCTSASSRDDHGSSLPGSATTLCDHVDASW